MTMLAAMFYAPQDIRLEQRPIPEPGTGEVLLLNGAYAEYLLVPERIVRQNLYHLAPETSFLAAALTEPLACALHGVDASNVSHDDTVVIVGAGPMGLLLAAVAKLRGGRVIIA